MVFLSLSILLFYVCLLATQKYSIYRIAARKKSYVRFAVRAAVFAVLMLLTFPYPMVGIAVTVAYIYLQLYDLHFGAKHSDPSL